MMNWDKLSDELKQRVLSFLPQQDKLNFLQTSYDNYVLTIAVLYRKLIFKKTSVLSANEIAYNDQTLIGASKNILLHDSIHDAIFESRQERLLESLRINEHLAGYIQEVTIFDNHNNTYESSGVELINPQLVEYIKHNCVNLSKYMIFNNHEAFHLTEFGHLKNLTSCMINHVHQLQDLPTSIRHLTVNFTDSYKKEINPSLHMDKDRCLEALTNLNSLILSSDEISSYIFLKFVIEQLKPTKKFRFSTLKIIFYHGFNDYNASLRNLVKVFLFKFTDLECLKNLEIIMGDDDKKCCCMTEFLDELNGQTNHFKQSNEQSLSKLTKLSLIEKTLHQNHDFHEKFDVALGRFIYNLPHPDKLQYLSIRHNNPLDGFIENGVEGNFLRRKKLYSHCFIKLVNLKTLVSPTFLQSCSCYEVITSDLLWNGCRCEFCELHLSLFDDFIITHHYYDETTGMLKDVITPRFFSVAGDSISKRLITYSDVSFNCSDLEMLQYPLFNSYWNFHSYFGFKHHEDEKLCHFNQSVFKSLCQVISHFEEAFVDDLSALLPKLGLVCFSGIFFKRQGGTGSLKNIFDEVPARKNIVGPHDYVLPQA